MKKSPIDARLPEGMDPLKDGRCCDLCGGRSFRRLHAWPVGDPWNPAAIPFAVWLCECGLVFLHPVPTAGQLPDRGDWWSANRKEFRRRRWFKKRWGKVRQMLIGTAKDRLLAATRKVMPSGRLLDVGCGDGKMMRLAGASYQCVGLEPSAAAAAIVRERGFSVIENTLEDAPIEPGSFDVVLMDSIIEHVHSPMLVLAKVNRILRVGGVVVLLTPKFGGPAYRMHKAGWNGFRHGYHTFLFTGETLGRYLEQNGFEVLRRPRRDRMLDDILILWGRKTRELAPSR
jgi:SAM-dependent methyltransferase